MNASAYVVRTRNVRLCGWATFLFLVFSQVYSNMISPPDRDMGHLQKIMYVHVPSAWVSFIAFACVFVASILYLWKRNPNYDLFALASAEVGTVLSALTLAQGSIWGRPTWGVWWTWDARILTMTILFLVYVSYLALRAFTDDEDRRARWSAAVGILGFINVPIVYMSVKWWRTLHQVQSNPSTVDPNYALGLRLNAFAFTFMFIYFAIVRYRGARAERMVAMAREDAALRGSGEVLSV
jgi:heme exporter protein C